MVHSAFAISDLDGCLYFLVLGELLLLCGFGRLEHPVDFLFEVEFVVGGFDPQRGEEVGLLGLLVVEELRPFLHKLLNVN